MANSHSSETPLCITRSGVFCFVVLTALLQRFRRRTDIPVESRR